MIRSDKIVTAEVAPNGSIAIPIGAVKGALISRLFIKPADNVPFTYSIYSEIPEAGDTSGRSLFATGNVAAGNVLNTSWSSFLPLPATKFHIKIDNTSGSTATAFTVYVVYMEPSVSY